MKLLKPLVLLCAVALLSSCTSESKNDTPSEQTEPPTADQVIEADEVDDQVKRDQERADSMKRALGIE